MVLQRIGAPSNDYVAHTRPLGTTVTVNRPQDYNEGTPQHEYTHGYENQVLSKLRLLTEGGNGASEDYGGIPGLEQRNSSRQTIAGLNPEQRAQAVGDAWNSQQKVALDARTNQLQPGEVQGFDRAQAAQAPLLRQMKNEGDAGIDVHPPAPGLPPASISGIVAPDPLLGGQWGLVNNQSGLKPLMNQIQRR